MSDQDIISRVKKNYHLGFELIQLQKGYKQNHIFIDNGSRNFSWTFSGFERWYYDISLHYRPKVVQTALREKVERTNLVFGHHSGSGEEAIRLSILEGFVGETIHNVAITDREWLRYIATHQFRSYVGSQLRGTASPPAGSNALAEELFIRVRARGPWREGSCAFVAVKRDHHDEDVADEKDKELFCHANY